MIHDTFIAYTFFFLTLNVKFNEMYIEFVR